MSLSRKHYRAIAKCVNDVVQTTYTVKEYLVAKRCAEELASYLRHTNPNFDKDKFLSACLEIKDDQDR